MATYCAMVCARPHLELALLLLLLGSLPFGLSLYGLLLFLSGLLLLLLLYGLLLFLSGLPLLLSS